MNLPSVFSTDKANQCVDQRLSLFKYESSNKCNYPRLRLYAVFFVGKVRNWRVLWTHIHFLSVSLQFSQNWLAIFFWFFAHWKGASKEKKNLVDLISGKTGPEMTFLKVFFFKFFLICSVQIDVQERKRSRLSF